MNYNNNLINKILLIICAIVFGIIVLFAAVFFKVDSSSGKKDEIDDISCEELKGWKAIYEGEEKEVDFPVSFDLTSNKEVILNNTLPSELDEEDAIDFYNSIDGDVYINGQLRYEYKEKNSFGGIAKQFHTFIKLRPEDAGGTISIVMRSDFLDYATAYRVYIGSKLGLIDRIVSANLTFYVFSVGLLIMASIALLVGVLLKFFRKSESPIIAVSISTLFVALWLVFNSELYQFIFHNSHIGGTMSYLMFLLIGYPVLAYINQIQKGRYVRIYAILCIIYQVVSIGFIVAHFTGVIRFQRVVNYLMGTVAIIFIACIIGIIGDIINKRVKEYFLSFLGMIIFLVYAIVEFVLYSFILERHTGTGIMIGTYIWITFAILQQLVALRNARESELAAINASEAKSNFLANMSHEIRTPMNAILGMDEMIIRESKGNEKVQKYANDIKSAGNMLLSIINDILDFSKIESGKAELVISRFDMRTVLNDVANITRSRAAEKGLSYHINVSEELPQGFVGDEVRLRQIMLNVINNGIKYTDEGYVGVNVEYKRMYLEDDKGKELVITVKDTGIGIKEQDIDKLFESFGRLEKTRNRNIEGTGLGLAITMKYLKMMNGDITVESEYGKGSVFTIHVPLYVWDTTPIGDFREAVKELPYKEEEYSPSIIAPEARLLIVDDNEMNLDVIDGLLERTRVHIDNAVSGPEAIELVEKKHYDLIMLDQMMPGMDGITTMSHIRNTGTKAPIIALTADAGFKELYIKEGFDGFIAKPVQFKELEEALVAYLPKNLQLEPDEMKEIIEKEKEDYQEINPLEMKKVLVIDNDPDYLQEVRGDIENRYKGTYVRDMDKAKKYLSRHDVDYIIVRDIDVIQNADKG